MCSTSLGHHKHTQETSLGKPLISDDALRGMYRCMQHLEAEKRAPGFARDLPRAARAALQEQPDAVLAALFSQLHRRDTVLTEDSDPLSQTASDFWFAHTGAPVLHATNSTAEECTALSVGMALRVADKVARSSNAMSPQRQQPVMVALLRSFPPLTSSLRLIQEHNLALLLIVCSEITSRAEAQKRLLSTGVPILPVDCNDAVAVCRVSQECLLRARNGWGGAVIHAVHMPGADDPLLLLRHHLERRGLQMCRHGTAGQVD